MVRVISQETFDAVVKENMEEFDMSRSEAVQEAKSQFDSQGVNLSNIVIPEGENDDIGDTVDQLKSLSIATDSSDINDKCEVLKALLSRGLAEKTMATRLGLFDVLINLLRENGTGSKKALLETLTVLVEGNPDPLTEAGLLAVKKTVAEEDLRHIALDFFLNVCVCHEYNRQNVVRSGLLKGLNQYFNAHSVGIARLWQALVQDDDVRVPYGKAHDHAREIVEDHEALTLLVKALSNTNKSEDLSTILSCMSSLSVRNEYCQLVADSGGLKIIFELLVDPDQDPEVIKEALKLTKTLAGNDNVKRDIGTSNGIPIIVDSISQKIGIKGICRFGCSALTALSLRHVDNAKRIVDCGGANLIAQVMKTHKTSSLVQVACAAAVRNIVSRSREHSDAFLENDIEELLREASVLYGSEEAVMSAINAALRDLNLSVKLEERWKGVKGSIEG